MIHCRCAAGAIDAAGRAVRFIGTFSADGDPLEVLARVVDFEAFRPTLVSVLAYSDGAKGGRPPYDPGRDAQSSGSGGAKQCGRCAHGMADPGPVELVELPGI